MRILVTGKKRDDIRFELVANVQCLRMIDGRSGACAMEDFGGGFLNTLGFADEDVVERIERIEVLQS